MAPEIFFGDRFLAAFGEDSIAAFCLRDLTELLGRSGALVVLRHFARIWPSIRGRGVEHQYKACGSFLRAANLPEVAADPLLLILAEADKSSQRMDFG